MERLQSLQVWLSSDCLDLTYHYRCLCRIPASSFHSTEITGNHCCGMALSSHSKGPIEPIDKPIKVPFHQTSKFATLSGYDQGLLRAVHGGNVPQPLRSARRFDSVTGCSTQPAGPSSLDRSRFGNTYNTNLAPFLRMLPQLEPRAQSANAVPLTKPKGPSCLSREQTTPRRGDTPLLPNGTSSELADLGDPALLDYAASTEDDPQPLAPSLPTDRPSQGMRQPSSRAHHHRRTRAQGNEAPPHAPPRLGRPKETPRSARISLVAGTQRGSSRLPLTTRPELASGSESLAKIASSRHPPSYGDASIHVYATPASTFAASCATHPEQRALQAKVEAAAAETRRSLAVRRDVLVWLHTLVSSFARARRVLPGVYTDRPGTASAHTASLGPSARQSQLEVRLVTRGAGSER